MTPPQISPTPARPGTVSISTKLLWLMALVSVIGAALAVYQGTFLKKDDLVRIYTEGGYPSDQADTAATFASIGAYVGAGFALLFGILAAILATFVGRGKQWARITTWIIAGLSICCGGFGLIGRAGTGRMSFGQPAGVDLDKINQDLADLMPSWLQPVSTALGVVSLLAAISIVILLAMPASHPFFRKQQPVWTPPGYPQP
jgi:hypothetical protein